MSSSQDISATDVLKLLGLDDPITVGQTCVGYDSITGKRCQTVVSVAGLILAREAAMGLANLVDRPKELESALYIIADLMLCLRLHRHNRGQHHRVVRTWSLAIRDYVKQARSFSPAGRMQDEKSNPRPSQFTSLGDQDQNKSGHRSTHTPEMKIEIEALLLEQQRLIARFEKQQRRVAECLERLNKKRPKSNEETQEDFKQEEPPENEETEDQQQRRAHIQAERRRADAEKAAKAKQEKLRQEQEQKERERKERERQEQERQEKARREEQAERDRAQKVEHERRRKEQETQRPTHANTTRERIRQEWETAWSRYDKAWEAQDFTGVLQDVLMWPVKSGLWRDVNESDIRAFMLNAPGTDIDDLDKFCKFLRQQIRCWHMDKMNKHFEKAQSPQEVLDKWQMVQYTLGAMFNEVKARRSNR